MTKMVDGVEVLMSADEEDAILAEWAANEVAAKQIQKTTAADPIINDPVALSDLKAALANAK